MAALSDNLEVNRQDGEIIEYPVAASSTIYKGALVCVNSSGYAVPASDTSNYVFVGVAVEKADNSSGSNGDEKVRVYKTGVYEYTKSSATDADRGTLMYVSDDQTVATSTTNSIKAGYCVDVVDSSTIKLRIDTVVQ